SGARRGSRIVLSPGHGGPTMLHLALIACLLPDAAPARARPFRFPAGKSGKAELAYVNRLPVLVVEGGPADLRAAVGKLARKPGNRLPASPRGLLGLSDVDPLWPAMLRAGKGMYRRFPSEYSDELEAMVEAADADRDKAIAGNTFFDVKKSLACSAV